MEFRDLKTQYQLHKDNIDKAIIGVAADTHYIGGQQVFELENKLADYVGVKHCISCANGTDALQLALMVWDIGPGDVVFVPDFTFFSTGEVVVTLGATPVFVDVDENTFNIDADKLECAINYVLNNTDLRPKVVAPVDLFGLPANFDDIRRIADKYNLLILEDAAQGFGGVKDGKKACSFGDISTTSFFPAKPLGCYGDGGAIFTDNDECALLLKSYKVHGKGSDKYDNVRIGMNSRLDTIQAAVLLEKLKFFDSEVEKCNEVAALYNKAFEGISGIKTPIIPNSFISSWAQYTILLDSDSERTRVIEELKNNGIPAMIYYKKPMHLQGAFAEVRVGDAIYGSEASLPEELECVVTSDICGRCLSLPMGAYVTDDDVELISSIISKCIK